MAIPIINSWQDYYPVAHEGLGSSYERIILNRLLLLLHKAGKFDNALEAPCFGFTGISGINLVALAQKSCQVLLEDHDPQRAALIRKSWQQLDLPLQIRVNPGYTRLDYADKSVDFGFNFSALWFVQNLPEFIAEFCRVIKKNILICVPNRDGIGFKGQLKGYSPEKYPDLHPQHIDPKSIVWLMQKEGWKLVKQGYIDCPPWPDIGMSKEDFFAEKLGRARSGSVPQPKEIESPLSIMPYYQGKDPEFERRMLRLYPFELLAPRFFKRMWAHHYYLLFQP
ncbi:MAG: class I SAM-dependent methyltransferase [Candidatus Cloacimonetes bacterium]|nr:class I SAM-dependent methyltransferase [Candidatus Cloacimonadota bacterium]MDY0171866.1 methyltransferase domain-containing protein [Candidatus Cloacimonadaceae bacterium]